MQNAGGRLHSLLTLHLGRKSKRATMMNHPGVPTRRLWVLVLFVISCATCPALHNSLSTSIVRPQPRSRITRPAYLDKRLFHLVVVRCVETGQRTVGTAWTTRTSTPPDRSIGASCHGSQRIESARLPLVSASGGTVPLGTPYRRSSLRSASIRITFSSSTTS